MARDSPEVSPVDIPIQTAIMMNSKGTVSPIAATAESPICAAKTVSIRLTAARIQNETTSGAAMRSTEGDGRGEETPTLTR